MNRPVCFWLVTLAAVLPFLGCSENESPQTAGTLGENATASIDSKKLRVALLPKIKGISYFSSCFKGADEAAKELRIELIYDGPTDGDPRKQAEMIEQWTIDGVDVICVAPNAPDVVAGAMKEARAAGISVITWDADGTAESRSFFVNQASAEAIGEGLVNAMLHDLGPEAKGDVVIVSADATSANQNAWIEAMKPALARSNLNLATIKYPGENASNALADSQDVINKYPNLKGIVGISSVSFPGAAEAVEQSDKGGQILVTGLSTPNDIKKFVHNGTVRSVVLWNTIDLGYLTMHVAKALASSELKDGATSIKAGRLGEISIVGDNVMLGDIMIFTKENIDQFDF
ncbi:MAG: substrate-binding domain-containing protein [Planctomycetota bacterium]|nr:substrate-binding domain-containing protein [Planctomycetota bacterium]